MEFDIGTDCPITHRRVVFTSGYNDERAYLTNKDNGKDLFRNLTEIPEDQYKELFDGIKGYDWTDIIDAPINRRKLRVLYDRRFEMSPISTNGKVYKRKFYHKVNKRVDFPVEEHGSDEFEGVSNWPSVKCPKYFVLDLVRSHRDTRDSGRYPLGEQYVAIGTHAKNYWTEIP